jgi:pyruvate kinase
VNCPLARIDEAAVVLDGILCRMAEHHYKKNALLQQLHSWRPALVQ